VGFTGRAEPPTFQERYSPGPARKYFRLTAEGRAASPLEWANPLLALYGERWGGEENAREHLPQLRGSHRYTHAGRR